MTRNAPSPPIKELLRQQELLKIEYEYEKETYQQQSERVGIRKKIDKGLCWYPIIIGRSRYNSLNQLTIEIARREDRETEHNFEYGRPVRFFRTDLNGRCHFLGHTCHVSYAEENRMVVVLPSEAALREIGSANELGIQLYFDETSYKTMFMALREVAEAKDNRLAELRELFLGADRAPRERELFPVRFPWLNPSQETAVNKVLRAKDVAIVHGPPGTGKTTTLVEAIHETLRRENQVLVCAQSNMAVDWISEKLVDRGIQVLRIGNPTRVNDKMLSFTYERRFESHPDYPELWSVRKAIRETLSGLRERHTSRDTARNRLSRLRYRATELEVKIDAELFDQARVVACTLVGSANRTLESHHFTSLFIDEAAQALEAACWIAIRKADRVLLAGDHWQLPPTIKCPEAERGGLGDTLMRKIATQSPAVVSLLTIQYRMREEIMGFSSRWFYQGQLKAAPEVSHRGILRIDSPLEWIDTSRLDIPEEERTENGSRVNQAEAQIAIGQLRDYIDKIGKERILDERIDFGVISPYKAQVQYLRQLMRREAFFRPLRGLITIHTVDGFQGQERDVILISLVRANERGKIGFLNDLRRMNVAITRARMKLIILGDTSTIARHPFYAALHDYIQRWGKITQIEPGKEEEPI